MTTVEILHNKLSVMDPCRVSLPVEIVHGRSQVTTQPDAPTCTFTWLPDPATTGPAFLLGDAIDVDTIADDDSRARRFSGYVDGLTVNEQGGQVVSWEVQAIGKQATLGYRPYTETRPAELDTARVAAIAAGVGVTITVVGGAGVTLAAQDYTDTDALSALHEVCASTGGMLWQTRAGVIVYGTAHHREQIDNPPTIPCQVIASGLGWSSTVDDIINDVTVKWSGGEATYTDEWSTAQPWGVRHADVSTTVAGTADAGQLAQLILRRRYYPSWNNPVIVVWPDDLPDPTLIEQVEVSAGVLLPLSIEQPGDAPTDVHLGVVEGWVETWDVGGRTIQMSVSDAARWTGVVLRTWAEVATQTWQYWSAGGTWSAQLIKDPGDPI